MNTARRIYWLIAVLAVLVVCLDQYTKYLVCRHIPLFGKIEIVSGWLNLVHIRNTGIAFGLLQNLAGHYRLAALVVVGAVALVLLVVLALQVRKHQVLQMISLALICGGAVGNMIDRLRLGEVVDFIDAHWQGLFHWPAFNVADAAISVGIVLIVLDELFLKNMRSDKGTNVRRQESEARIQCSEGVCASTGKELGPFGLRPIKPCTRKEVRDKK